MAREVTRMSWSTRAGRRVKEARVGKKKKGGGGKGC
jgi:hypothetical protein